VKISNRYFPLLLTCTLTAPNASAWQLQELDSDSPIQIWTQKVPNSSFKAFKGQVTIQASLQKTLAIIRDTKNIPKWYHNTSEARKLKTINENQSINYSVSTTPWPVTDRDAVTLVTQKILEGGVYFIELTARPNMYPKQDHRIRIPKLEGYWKLVPLDKIKTEVTFQVAAEPGGEIPSWLANAMVIDMPFHTLNNLKERVETAP